MAERKEDRRVRRTNRLLGQALTALMREKAFQEISVRDITERADMNRGTFYMHYASTYDLLSHLENETLRDFQGMIDDYGDEGELGDLRGLLEPIADYIEANAEICKCLFQNRASTDFMDKFQRLIYENGAARVRRRYPDVPEEALRGFFAFATFGMIGVIKQWIDGGLRLDKRELVRRAGELIAGAAERGLL